MLCRENLEFVQGPLPEILAGQYAETRSIYKDKTTGTTVVVPKGWTVSGASEENSLDNIILYMIPEDKVNHFDWQHYTDLEYIKRCYSSVVYFEGHLISRYPIRRIGNRFMSIKLKTHLPLMSYYEGKGRAEEFFFSKYEHSKLCDGPTLESFLEWFKNHNSEKIELAESPNPKKLLTFVFAEIVVL